MTKQESLEIVRAACIKANPQILELGFGCEVKRYKTPEIDTVVKYFSTPEKRHCVRLLRRPPHDFDTTFDFCCETDEFEGWIILGRPIRLVDVLWSFKTGKHTRKTYCQVVESLCELSQWHMDKDDLREQSEECLVFLAELLK